MFHATQIKDIDSDIIYHCGDKSLHREKALFFKDKYLAQDIMMAEMAVECKALGRHVKSYNHDQWYKSGHTWSVMKKINMAKFKQNPELLVFLKKNCTSSCRDKSI